MDICNSIMGLRTLLCNGNDFVDMEAFGKQREERLRGLLTLPNGIPDSDTFRRVLEKLDPEALSERLCDWPERDREKGSVIAVDGKTTRGSGNESHKAHHVVSAFVAENQMILGELVNVLRKVALTLCRNADLGKRVSIQKKRFLASLNPDFFLSLLFGRS